MKEIELTRGFVAVVDDEDYESVSGYSWSVYSNGGNKLYAKAYNPNDGTLISLHRFLMRAQKGELVDHKDGNGLNCTKQNMRIANQSQNQANRGLPKTNTSGYKGIRFDKRSGKWMSSIIVHGKNIFLGTFATPEEAARAYDDAAVKYHGEFAWTNFPRMPDENKVPPHN